MNQKPYFKILPDGTVSVIPTPTKAAQVDYTKTPVQFSVRRDLTVEIHGENFSATIALDTNGALDIVSMLAFGMRAATYALTPCEFVEVTA